MASPRHAESGRSQAETRAAEAKPMILSPRSDLSRATLIGSRGHGSPALGGTDPQVKLLPRSNLQFSRWLVRRRPWTQGSPSVRFFVMPTCCFPRSSITGFRVRIWWNSAGYPALFPHGGAVARDAQQVYRLVHPMVVRQKGGSSGGVPVAGFAVVPVGAGGARSRAVGAPMPGVPMPGVPGGRLTTSGRP